MPAATPPRKRRPGVAHGDVSPSVHTPGGAGVKERGRHVLLCAASLWLSACGDGVAPRPIAPPATPAPWSDAWILDEGRRFLTDTGARRAALEASLTNPGNLYSRIRLAAYGLGTGGWDRLPAWNPRSMPVTAAVAASLARDEIPALPPARPPLWDGVTPTTMAGWVALGRRVFFEYPMRAEVFMEYALTQPALADAVGIERTAAGDVPGLVVFANIDGERRVGITCAICHAMVSDGALVVGQARRTFDYGRLRLTYDQIHDTVRSPDEARRMASWGPGRADVTEDDDEDPVAIPDLWGLRAQPFLTAAGTIRHASPMALAIRQETQLTDSNHAMVRPPRELAWALAMFVYALAPPARAVASPPSPRGAALFATHCASCHANAAFGGRVIPVAMIGTDRALASGRGRGTGTYRVPPLLGVGAGAPYLHDGMVPSLAALLSPTRTAPGHRAGTDLTADDRAALIAYLETL
ncbi:MAG: c-type cytochrome [Proteobacteria bacterium]|nr:c-type cytochrome [Pseudomonadota bacterium]